MMISDDSSFVGLLAEFETPEALADAITMTKRAGYSCMEAYMPLPDHHVIEALGHKTRLPYLVLAGGILGGAAAYGLQYYFSVVAYPVIVGGKPLHSWPAFMVVTFEMTVLFAALSAVFGMLVLNRLPKYHHPILNVEAFSAASQNRFFLFVSKADPQWDATALQERLESTNALAIHRVPS